MRKWQAEGRSERNQQSGEERDREHESNQMEVQAKSVEERHGRQPVFGDECDEQLRGPVRKRQAEHAADECEHQPLSYQLAYKPGRGRAQGAANCDLTLPPLSANQ